MAVNNLSKFNASNDAMAMPLSMQRGNPNPLDPTDLFSSKDAADTYAKESAISYVGQIISVVTDDSVKAYQIVDTNGTLQELGSGSGSDDSLLVTCEESVENGVKHWKFKQNDTEITDVTMDADIFLQSGKVTTVTSNVDADGDTAPENTADGTYLKLILTSGDKVYIAARNLGGTPLETIKLGETEYTNNSGTVTISSISTDILTNGSNELILNGGTSAVS